MCIQALAQEPVKKEDAERLQQPELPSISEITRIRWIGPIIDDNPDDCACMNGLRGL
jgi:hypothetical protein